jgi:hypothetical protein
VQKASRFVYGITELQNDEALARWRAPVCPAVRGLRQEQGEWVLGRVTQIVRAARASLAGQGCLPDLGNWSSFLVNKFINSPGPIRVWHGSYEVQPPHGVYTFGFVYVVVDGTRLQGVSQGQFADYVGMVSLVAMKSNAHVGDAQTILKLFDGLPEAAPAGLSDWDRAFLKMLYTPEWTLAKERPNIALRMVRELVP